MRRNFIFLKVVLTRDQHERECECGLFSVTAAKKGLSMFEFYSNNLLRDRIVFSCFPPIYHTHTHTYHTPIKCVSVLDAHTSNAFACQMDGGRGSRCLSAKGT